MNYFLKFGQLARAGHVDLKNIRGMAGIGQAWWATLEPYSRRYLAIFGVASASMSDFQWLVGKFAEITKRWGVTTTYDDAYLRDSLERRLAIVRDMLRVEQSLRTVIVAAPDALTDAAAAPAMAPAVAEG